MMPDKIDVKSIVRKAGELTEVDIAQGKLAPALWTWRRDEHVARLVLEEAAKVCESMPAFQRCLQGDFDPTTPLDCAIAIRKAMP
jgi:hypothetical protein